MKAAPPPRSEALETEFSWRRDALGYKIENFGRYGPHVLGRGGKMVESNPLAGGQTYLAFAHVDSHEKLLQFVELHGLLEHEKNPRPTRINAKTFKLIPGEQTEGEDVEDLLQKARGFREVLRWNANRRKRPSEAAMSSINRLLEPEGLGRVYLDLGSGLGPAGGSLRPIFRPDTLLNGMLWQLGLAVSGGKRFRTCTWCGSLFEVGPGSGRRAHSEYCSPEHRVLFNSRNRSRSAREAAP